MKKIFLKVRNFAGTPFRGWCGPSTLKIIFDFYGLNIAEKKLAQLCGTNREFGTNVKKMEKVSKDFGFKFRIQDNSNFKEIEKWLKKGIPVIVDWFTRGRNDYNDSDVADGHYSVVVGLDDKYIYVSDPEIGRVRKMEREKFLMVWFDFKGNQIKKPTDIILRRMIVIYK